MAKSVAAERARKARLKEGRLLQKQIEKTEKAKLRRIKELKKLKAKRGKTFKKVVKAYKYKPRLSKTLLGYSAAFGGGHAQQQGQRPVGRPPATFKHRDPQTGQPIPATLYYKRVRELRRLAEQQARLRDIQQIQQLAKQGIPPEQAKQIVDLRQLQQAGVQPQQIKSQNPYNQQPNIPEGMPTPPKNPTIWRGRRGVVGKDIGLFGPREVVFGLPESFWN